MRTRLTLRARSGLLRDVEIRGPYGTTVADVRDAFAVAVGRVSAPTRSDSSPEVWAGSRNLPAAALLGGPGLRSGSVVGLDEPGPRDLVAQAILRLHIVGGPDAGTVYALPRGTVTVGRGIDCDVRLSDADCSREHLELAVTTAGISVRDLNSTNGTWLVRDDGSDPEPVEEHRPISVGQYVAIGSSVLSLATVTTPAAATSLAQDGAQLVNRPPRLTSGPAAHAVEFPAAPGFGSAQALPWLAALIPALGGGALAWFMHNMQFLAFVLLSPVLMLATSVSERLSGRRSRCRERSDYRRKDSQAGADVLAQAAAETRLRRQAHPDPAELLHVAATPSARIWERRRLDSDFLDIRVGLADRPAWFEVRRGSVRVDPPLLRSVPVWTNLGDGALGVCGPRALVLGVARWALTQLACLHSPADLGLVAFLDDGDEPAWSWLRWLPHLGGSAGEREGSLARSAEQRSALLSRLLARVDAAPLHDRRPWTGPWTVVLVDRASTLSDTPGLVRLLAEGPAVGITAVCLDDEQRRLPPSCASVIRLTGETGSRVQLRVASDSVHARSRSEVGDGDSGPPFDGVEVLADQVRPSYVDRLARALAPLADPGSDVVSALPGAVRLLDLLQVQDVEPEQILARWARSDGRARTALGISAEGTFSIDLGRDGPHALVAGTTGAGKSELLQSIVAGLAVHSSPQDLQFVLIDYKGGAAFADCARLPHTAGLVTDLDGHLTERALRSLEAELKRRETLFAQAGTADLAGYRASAVHRCDPLGRLVLVVDEFAALAEELPDFVTGIVGIAQRGRSLGVHLVLATQRPAGVISPEIRANVGMRIALRVTDAAESSDVLGTDDAAAISKSTPGRAIVAIGTTLSPVQIGRIAVPVDVDSSRVDVVALDAWGAPVAAERPDLGDATTDLQVLVSALRLAARNQGHPAPQRPWLEPLGAIVDAGALGDPTRARSSIAIGTRDVPGEQAQRPVLLDLGQGQTMLLAGGARSGRTSVLRTLAALAADALPVSQVHIYAIDCAGGGLRVLDALPHCGAVVGRDAATSVSRLLQRLSAEVERRAQLLAAAGVGTTAEARVHGLVLPTMMLLLDGWEGFTDAVQDVDNGDAVETLLALLRDGAAVGLFAVIAGNRGALAGRLASAVSLRYVLHLSDSADYAMAGLSRKAIPTSMPPGRALDALDSSELQFAVFGTDPSTAAQNAAVLAIAQRARQRVGDPAPGNRPMKLRALPVRTRLADLYPHVADVDDGHCAQRRAGAVLIGVGGDDATALGMDLFATADAGDARVLIAGPPRSGRSTVTQTMAAQLSVQALEDMLTLVLAAGPRSGLRRWAAANGLPVLAPDGRDRADVQEAFQPLFTRAKPTVLLIDDCAAFLDTPVGDWLTELIRTAPVGMAVVGSGRSDDMAMAFRGVAAELKRARTGVLLQPGPGDGDVFGISLPLRRPVMPNGRGLLMAPGAVFRAAAHSDFRAAARADADLASNLGSTVDAEVFDDTEPIPIQIAL